jgi:hypothetical protein
MITQDGNHLIVLEDMSIDWNLPKYKKPAKGGRSKGNVIDLTDEDSDMSEDSSNGGNFRLASNVVWNQVSGTTSVQLVPYNVQGSVTKSPSLFDKLTSLWKKAPPPPPPEPEPPLSIEDFFKSVKNTQQELTVVEERAAGYERAMANAKQAGQQALFEKLAAGLNAYKMETQLVAMGLTKFVSEEDIVRFYKQCKKGLRLDYVRNFSRVIPEGIVAKQARANELGLFDNYVVLHYDPQAKSYAETEAEKARRKDPILFGLMKGRRQLYVVGDWIDEVCDLTLDQLAEQIGKGAVQSLTTPNHPYRDVT